jgi:hypothetical protein
VNRTAIVLGGLLAVSAVANAVLVLRARPRGEVRPAGPGAPPAPGSSDAPPSLACGHEAEIARLRREVADLKSRDGARPSDRTLRDQAVVALQQEQEKQSEFWAAQERGVKEGGGVPNADAAITAAIEFLELPDGPRTQFFDTARTTFADVDRARGELEAVARRVTEAGGSANDDPDWIAANQRLHERLRTASARLRGTLDRANPRQNGFAANMERWVYLVTQPFRR